MKRLLPYLIFFNGVVNFLPAAYGQCGYAASVITNKDYCVGSSLLARAEYPLERIVWYKDGQPVDSVTATQSLAAKPVVISLGGIIPGYDVTTDEAGNVYTVDGAHYRVVKWTPGSGTAVTTVAYTDAARLFVDHQENLYVASSGNVVLKYPPGSFDSSIVVTGRETDYQTGLYVDCQGAVYFGDGPDAVITKWPAGATTGRLVAGEYGNGSGPGQIDGINQLSVDSAGNIFVLTFTTVQEWAPGATSGVEVANWGGLVAGSDMWMDGKDTIYIVGWQGQLSDSIAVYKCVPGTASFQRVCAYKFGNNGSTPPAMTVDSKGNIYIVDGEDPDLYEFPRISAIDSAYMPTTPGAYYAVVTDMQGYAATTNTIVINTPSSGTPSIQISSTATSTPVCTPITFTATSANAGIDAVYQWDVSGLHVGGDSTTYSNNLFANGDKVYCILTAQAGCTGTVTDTSNIVTLDIDPQGAASVTIATPKDSICQGSAVAFTATVTNGSNQPVFNWLLNGDSTGDDSATYSRDNFVTGDIVTCVIVSDDVCGLAKSNSIAVLVSIPPVIAPGQIFTIPYGKSTTLDPVVSGDVSSWNWTPVTGLSDPHIQNPVADPAASTLYTLAVMAAGGCGDTATILVDVYTPLGIPNAFTPNGDGHNDRFYVLGGPVNSVVEELAVFDRWGQAVFQLHNAAPGDANAGWDGRVHGQPAPPGTYVYIARMKYADGSGQTYKGTVMLIR